MCRMTQRFESAMRRTLAFALLLALVAAPMAFAGVGFCRSMPCCPPHLGAHVADLHQPDCCNTTDCDQLPDAAGEYTNAKTDQPHFIAALPLVAILPASVSIEPG